MKAKTVAIGAVSVAVVAVGTAIAALAGNHPVGQAAPFSSTPTFSSAPAPVPTDPAPASTDPAPVPSDTPSTDPSGPLGTSFTVTDSSNNVYDVTASKVIDPARGADEFNNPSNGTRFVGVVFTIKATSGKADDAGDNCAKLMASDGQAYDANVSSIAGYPGSTLFKLNAGTSQTFAEVFELPRGVTPQSIQWTPESGMGSTTATWSVG